MRGKKTPTKKHTTPL